MANPSLKRLMRKHNGQCHYCRRHVVKDNDGSNMATRDHVLPQSQGGSYRVENLVLACKRCNNVRGSMAYSAFVELANEGSLPDIRYRPAFTQTRRRIAKTVVAENRSAIEELTEMIAESAHEEEDAPRVDLAFESGPVGTPEPSVDEQSSENSIEDGAGPDLGHWTGTGFADSDDQVDDAQVA